jgi:hypothetical protein
MNGWQFGLLITPMILAFLTSTVAAILGVINSGRLNNQAIVASKQTDKIEQVHILFNSRMTELLAMTARSSHAEGMAEGARGRIADQARLADPTGPAAVAASARDERTADAAADREIRATDATAARAIVAADLAAKPAPLSHPSP